MTLHDIAYRLGRTYAAWKNAENEKNEARKDFFRAATDSFQIDDLAERVVTIPVPPDQAREYCAKHYPEWMIVEHPSLVSGGLSKDSTSCEVILREDPAYKPFVYIDYEAGMVYQRQLSQGSPMLDDERLKKENHDLYERVTFIPEPQRELRPFEELEPMDLADLRPYIYYNRPTVKLAAPRKARTEELVH